MNISVNYCTYNSYGGDKCLSILPYYLIPASNTYGAGLQEIELTIHLKSKGPPKKTLDALFDDYNELINHLPKVIFKKSKKSASIAVLSEIYDGCEFGKSREITTEKVENCASMILAALIAGGQKLGRIKDYDHKLLIADCVLKISHLPRTLDGVTKLINDCENINKAEIAALSLWEKLDIDWSKYPADIKKLLDDTLFWDCADDFSPHGNDTGADLLDYFRKWLKKNPESDSMEFYYTLLSQWGIPRDSDDPVLMPVLDEAAVALAFAEIKYKMCCSRIVYENAKLAISNQRRITTESIEWDHRDLRMRYLSIIENKLDIVPH